jgi:hypothetical protein
VWDETSGWWEEGWAARGGGEKISERMTGCPA